ncbi:MAG: hypothetical protein KDE20_06145 [Caldilineaceae bacterium]|nr:hypothetical protein [Caldilineaceae bacterium]
MASDFRPRHSFMLRLWHEELGDDQSEWRGELIYLRSGEVRYFRDERTLQTTLWHMLLQGVDEEDEQ